MARNFASVSTTCTEDEEAVITHNLSTHERGPERRDVADKDGGEELSEGDAVSYLFWARQDRVGAK